MNETIRQHLMQYYRSLSASTVRADLAAAGILAGLLAASAEGEEVLANLCIHTAEFAKVQLDKVKR